MPGPVAQQRVLAQPETGVLPIGKGLMNECLICRGRDVYQRPVEGLITGGLQALNPCLTV